MAMDRETSGSWMMITMPVLSRIVSLKVMLEEDEGLTHESQFAGCGKWGKATTLAGRTKACKLFRLVPDAFD